ncbi:MAG: hypothetical protein WC756_00725 [Taibaiella sp.]|jgi:hypothetical protein
MELIKQYWEGIIAGLALLTSLWSALISFKTFKLQREHNIKSVKPILQIGQWDYENNLCVDLRNSGSGIAIVTMASAVNKTDVSKNCIYDWLPKKLIGNMNYKEYWTAYKSFVLQPGQIIKLIEIPIDTSIDEQKWQREEIRSTLRQLTIKVSYEDIYGNKMEDKKSELYHFSRTDNEN